MTSIQPQHKAAKSNGHSGNNNNNNNKYRTGGVPVPTFPPMMNTHGHASLGGFGVGDGTTTKTVAVPASQPLEIPSGLSIEHQRRLQKEFEDRQKSLEMQQRTQQTQLHAKQKQQQMALERQHEASQQRFAEQQSRLQEQGAQRNAAQGLVGGLAE